MLKFVVAFPKNTQHNGDCLACFLVFFECQEAQTTISSQNQKLRKEQGQRALPFIALGDSCSLQVIVL